MMDCAEEPVKCTVMIIRLVHPGELDSMESNSDRTYNICLFMEKEKSLNVRAKMDRPKTHT